MACSDLFILWWALFYHCVDYIEYWHPLSRAMHGRLVTRKSWESHRKSSTFKRLQLDAVPSSMGSKYLWARGTYITFLSTARCSNAVEWFLHHVLYLWLFTPTFDKLGPCGPIPDSSIHRLWPRRQSSPFPSIWTQSINNTHVNDYVWLDTRAIFTDGVSLQVFMEHLKRLVSFLLSIDPCLRFTELLFRLLELKRINPRLYCHRSFVV